MPIISVTIDMLDFKDADDVEVRVSGKNLWVNRNGECVLRIYNIKDIQVHDDRRPHLERADPPPPPPRDHIPQEWQHGSHIDSMPVEKNAPYQKNTGLKEVPQMPEKKINHRRTKA